MELLEEEDRERLRAKFALLDTAFAFLSRHRAVPSVRNLLSMANSLGGSKSGECALSAGDVRVMARMAPQLLVLSERVADDVFRPTELTPLEREIVAFPLAPQSSKRASEKRKKLFAGALAAAAALPSAAAAAAADTTTTVTTLSEQEGERVTTADPTPPSDFASASSGAAFTRWLRMLQALPFYNKQLVHVERRPPRAAQLREIADLPLSTRVQTALAKSGIRQLYSHQFDAIDALLRGENVVLSTSTASGKSLAYNVPMLTTLLEDERATFLYMFPTKALAQDQMKSLRNFLAAADLPLHLCSTFDGDTPMKSRSMVIRETQVFLTNPDMLHLSILPKHTQWKRVLASLKLIVVDEAHMYRGVFGSHVACVFRRLFRLCALYGANPQVVSCSATVQNPRQHFQLLIPTLPPRRSLVPTPSDSSAEGDAAANVDTSPPNFDFFRDRPLRVITEDGAPTGEKFFCLWNPYVNDAPPPPAAAAAGASKQGDATTVPRGQAGGKRKRPRTSEAETSVKHASSIPSRDTKNDEGTAAQDANSIGTSAIFHSAKIFSRFMEDDVHTILFCRGRKLTELVLMTVHSIMGDDARARALLRRVSTYRGGYTLDDRRSIERRLFSGELLGVIATNALELGIDVGDLDCTMHLGLPSSIASLWQQAGRAGRKHMQQSIAVIVCFDSPLDQHFCRHAPELFQLKPEAVALNPSNVRVLGQHLLCAARESPLYEKRSGMDYIDSFMFGDPTTEHTASGALNSDAVAAQILAEFVQEQKLLQCPLSDGGGYRLHSCMPKQFRVVNLRSIAEFVYQVVTDDAEQKVLDEIPGDMVFFQVYPAGVYLHQAQEYLITKVDNDNKVAYAKKCVAPLKYFTRCKDITFMDIVRVHSTRRVGKSSEGDEQLQLSLGVVSLLTRVDGSTVLEKRTLRFMYTNEFSLPPMQSFGNALWLKLPASVKTRVESAGFNWLGALHGVGHLCIAIVSLFVLCESADVNTEHYDPLEQRARPNHITIYERREGGSGVIEEIHRVLPEVVEKAWTIASECACEAGCPACIHSSECSGYNAVLDKRGSLVVLEFLHQAFSAARASERR